MRRDEKWPSTCCCPRLVPFHLHKNFNLFVFPYFIIFFFTCQNFKKKLISFQEDSIMFSPLKSGPMHWTRGYVAYLSGPMHWIRARDSRQKSSCFEWSSFCEFLSWVGGGCGVCANANMNLNIKKRKRGLMMIMMARPIVGKSLLPMILLTLAETLVWSGACKNKNSIILLKYRVKQRGNWKRVTSIYEKEIIKWDDNADLLNWGVRVFIILISRILYHNSNDWIFLEFLLRDNQENIWRIRYPKHQEFLQCFEPNCVEGFASASLSQVSYHYYCCATVIIERHLT